MKFPQILKKCVTAMVLILLLGILPTGCAVLKAYGPHKGEPEPLESGDQQDATDVIRYANQLSEYYKAKSDCNRYAIYAAQAIVLAGATAIGIISGIGAGNEDVILSITGGTALTSGLSAKFQNEQKANVFVDGAKRVREATSRYKLNAESCKDKNEATIELYRELESIRNTVDERIVKGISDDIEITTTRLEDATVTEPYADCITALGTAPDLRWSIVRGAEEFYGAGFELRSKESHGCILSEKVRKIEGKSISFTVQVMDVSQRRFDEREFSIKIKAAK